jgi:hypothetical protein
MSDVTTEYVPVADEVVFDVLHVQLPVSSGPPQAYQEYVYWLAGVPSVKPDAVAVNVAPNFGVPVIATEPAVGAPPWTTLVAEEVALAGGVQPEAQVLVAVITTLR